MSSPVTLVFLVRCYDVLAFRMRSDPECRRLVCFRAFSCYMGRAGIEPATLGLKVDPTRFACSRVSSQGGMVSRIGSGEIGWSRGISLTLR